MKNIGYMWREGTKTKIDIAKFSFHLFFLLFYSILLEIASPETRKENCVCYVVVGKILVQQQQQHKKRASLCLSTFFTCEEQVAWDKMENSK